MIKPYEVKSYSTQYTVQHMQEAEAEFDAAIRVAEEAGAWPARVTRKRDTTPFSAIEATAQRYRDAGWRVDLPIRGDYIAQITPP